MKKILIGTTLIGVMFWVATAIWGNNTMYKNFDQSLIAPDVNFNMLDNLKNMHDFEYLKSNHDGDWAYRKCYAVSPFFIYYKFAIYSNKTGGLAAQGISFWFFGLSKNIWTKPYWQN